MSKEDFRSLGEKEQQIADLVLTLCDAERELQKLTGGELDAVAIDGGRTYLLSEAQENLRVSEKAQRIAAEIQASILDALPAHLALIDQRGVILSVNQSWAQFGIANALQGSSFYVGHNYLEVCERGSSDSEQAKAAAIGIRRVLNGTLGEFALEYPCHSPNEQRWFRLMVAPVRGDRPAGAVVMHVDITERRLAETALRITMEEFRTLAESMPQIVWTARPDGLATYFNEHWMDYTGFTLDESLGDGWNKPYHPEDRPRAQEAWQKALATAAPYVFEARLRRADGEYRWWLMRGLPQLISNGKVLKWFGTCTDIHDLKLAEMEISRTNRALKMLSACNEKLIRAVSEQDLLDDICGLTVEIGGYTMAWVGYVRTDECSTVEPMAFAGAENGYLSHINVSWSANSPFGLGPAGRAIRSGRPEVCEDIELDPHFSPWLELARQRGYRSMICLPLRYNSKVFGILALYSAEVFHIAPDEMNLLTELASDLAFGVEHLRAIRETQEQAALLNAASDGIILRSVRNQLLFWNQGAERLFGWEAIEVLGEDPRKIYVSDAGKFDEAVQLLMERGTWAGELSMHSKDGRDIIVDARWTLLRDQEGEPKSVLEINSDITERKKLENQLLRAQRLESLGTLAGGVAHDLNNALAPIIMGAGLLKNEINSDFGQQILASMEIGAQHSADLVKQVLSFARGVEGKRIPINIVHVLNDIRDMIRDTFQKNIDFRYNPGRGTWSVIGDPTQMHQVITNLCVNARDAMPNGGTLKVSTENTVLDDVYAGMNPDSKAGPYVVLKVEDTGSGIPPAIREKIFEPFFTTKEIGKGTGLGLSTTIGIVKSHGGFINLYSEMGKGTTFKVYLPANAKSDAAENVAVEQTGLPRGNGETVLLVDDENTIQQVAQKTLERFGYRVLIAANGAEGVAVYAQHREQIAVVLTDMAMPVMDGPAMIIALKSLNPTVRIIGSSGLTSNGGAANAIGAGVNHFIPKPYTAEAMLTSLAACLGEQVSQTLERRSGSLSATGRELSPIGRTDIPS